MNTLGKLVDGITGKTAGDAAIEGANIAAGYQEEALDYLKETQAPLLEAQQFGLGGLMDFYGGNQQGTIDQVMASPFYNSMIEQGEEAVLRNAAATGGLRGGAVQPALAQNSQNVLQGLTQQHLSGLSQLSGYQPNTSAVAQQTSNIGQTYSQGTIAEANARQAGVGNVVDLGLKAGGMFI